MSGRRYRVRMVIPFDTWCIVTASDVVQAEAAATGLLDNFLVGTNGSHGELAVAAAIDDVTVREVVQLANEPEVEFP